MSSELNQAQWFPRWFGQGQVVFYLLFFFFFLLCFDNCSLDFTPFYPLALPKKQTTKYLGLDVLEIQSIKGEIFRILN